MTTNTTAGHDKRFIVAMDDDFGTVKDWTKHYENMTGTPAPSYVTSQKNMPVGTEHAEKSIC